MQVGFTIACAIGVVMLLLAEWRRSQTGKWIAKPLSSACFVAVALENGALSTPFGRVIAAALALSWLGDVLLIPRAMALFRLGLFSFLLGHVAFAASFVLRGVDWTIVVGSSVLLAAIAAGIARWLMPHVENKMRGPVLAYITVISAMVALAAGTVAAHGHPVLLCAAVAFFGSDLAVARDRFVKAGFINRVWGLPLYYAAVLLFAWSVRDAPRFGRARSPGHDVLAGARGGSLGGRSGGRGWAVPDVQIVFGP